MNYKYNLGDGPIEKRGKTFRRCHECDCFRNINNLYKVEAFDSPWDDEPRTIYVCRDDVYTPSRYNDDCFELLTDTGWADFRYFTCGGCFRLVIRQCPSNGWHSYVRIVNECEEWCLRCYEEELLENGLNDVGREALEEGSIPGMFFNENELPDAGWEQVGEDRFINSEQSAHDLCDEVLNLMDKDFKVIVGYLSLGIGGGEGYVSLWKKGIN